MKRLVACVVPIVLASSVLATTYASLSLEEQVQKAEVIVYAGIKGSSSEEFAGKPWTVYTLEPKRFLRGTAADLPQTEGLPSFKVLGGSRLRFEGAPTFNPGEEVVLFLYKKRYDSPVVGVRQGAYRVMSGGLLDLDGKPVSLNNVPTTLDAFLKRVEAIIGGAK